MKLNNIVFIVLGIVLLGGLFFFFKPQEKQKASESANSQTASPTPAKTTKTFELVVKDGKLASGSSVLKAQQNDNVVIKITNDEDEELHLHGYDKSVDLEKGKQASLSFKATLTGRFPFELEKSKTELGVLEVQPK